MRIAVILRLVPDTLEDLPLEDGQLDWDEVSLKLNEFDDHALEEAVLLKEELGATVIAVALAEAGDRILQTAIARGADRAVQIAGSAREGAHSRALAPLFAEAVHSLQANLVLTGIQTLDDVFGQLAPFLAVKLGWPQVSGVTSVAAGDNDRILAVQEYGGGRSAVLSVAQPAVFGIQAARQAPRYVSGSRLRQAISSTSLEQLTLSAPLDDDRASIISLQPPGKTSSVVFLDEDPAIAADQIVSHLADHGIKGKRSA